MGACSGTGVDAGARKSTDLSGTMLYTCHIVIETPVPSSAKDALPELVFVLGS